MNESRSGGFRPQGFAPVKPGDVLTVKIEAVGEKGDGIAKVSGFVLFVPNAKEGQEVKVKITRVLRRVGFAEITDEQVSASPSAQKARSEPQAPPVDDEVEDSEDFGEESSDDNEEASDDTDDSDQEDTDEEKPKDE